MNNYYYHFLTFHTGGRYRKAAKRLVDSAKPYGIKVDVLQIKDQGAWHRNVNRKAEIILQWYLKNKKPFVVLDADCVIHQEPVLFKKRLADISHLYCKDKHWFISTGVCAFDSNDLISSLLHLWAKFSIQRRLNQDPIKVWKSDFALKKAFQSISKYNTINKTILPRTYGKPYWLDWRIKSKDIVISCNERCTLYEDGLYHEHKRKRKDNLDVKPV